MSNSERIIENNNELNIIKSMLENKASIIERIENENGTAIKFYDGTMIATTKMVRTDVAINNVYGSLYISPAIVWTFPVAFIETPVVTCGMFHYGTSASWGICSSAGTNAANINGYDFYSRASGTKTTITVTAIGRWK